MQDKHERRSLRLHVLLAGISLTCLGVGVAMIVYALSLMTTGAVGDSPVQVAEDDCPPVVAPTPARLSPQQLITEFHKLIYDSNVWQRMEWMGVRTLQYPPDMWVMQEIIYDVRPDFIVETGTFHGGSALFYASVLEILGGEGKVITIDIEPRIREASQYPVFRERVEVITGSSTDPEVLAQVRERVAGKTVMVTMDSDHSKEHVLAELHGLAPLVSLGSYVVVQDTNLNGNPVASAYGPGPFEAVEKFLEGNDEFERDPAREKFLVTFFPGGFLKRVKAAPDAALEL